MPAYQGRLSTLSIQRGGTGDYVNIDGLTDITLNRELSEAETSHHGSDGNRTFLPDWSSATITGSGIWIEDDNGQGDLEESLEEKEMASFQFRMAVGGGLNEYTASGFVTELSPTGPNEGTGDFSFSIRISGEVTKEAQTT